MKSKINLGILCFLTTTAIFYASRKAFEVSFIYGTNRSCFRSFDIWMTQTKFTYCRH